MGGGWLRVDVCEGLKVFGLGLDEGRGCDGVLVIYVGYRWDIWGRGRQVRDYGLVQEGREGGAG